MNKRCYRIIFNQKRGQLMAVAETAVSEGKSAGSTGETTGLAASLIATLRPMAFTVMAALGMVLCVAPADAQIVAYKTAPGSQQATVLQAGNGVPLVNIQTPSAAGVSRNTYSQFDVTTQGAILNNSRTNVQTQLGGWVQGNPWLATGAARVILNEVISANPSQLLGYLEVAGSNAQVIIANPSGVTCSGCGFINAGRVTLTTGTPIIAGGNLEGYRVEGGNIRIEGNGMDASRVGYTDLIARSVEVNAGLWANTVKVSTGSNQVDAEHTQTTAIAGAGAAPTYALDVAQLGGMYVGKITLVGTEAGVGVRNAGQIGASAGEVVITADGQLQNSGRITATSHVAIGASAGIANSGTIYAQNDLSLTTHGNINNTGRNALIAAGNNATLAASGASSQINGDTPSIFAAGLNGDGSLASTGRLELNASQKVSAHGQQIAGGDIVMAARKLDLANSQNSARDITLTASAGDLDLSATRNVARQALTAHTSQTLLHSDARSNAGQLKLTAQGLDNTRGEIIQTGSGNTTIALAGDLDNSTGRIASNSQNLALSAQTITNIDGRIEHAGTGSLVVAANTLTGTRGNIISNGALSLSADTATVDSGNTIAKELTITAKALSNQGGTIAQTGTGEAKVTVNNRFDNRAGTLTSNGRATIGASELDNRATGKILSSGKLALSTGTLNNDGGKLSTGNDLQVSAVSSISNVAGIIAAGNDLDFTAASLDNTSGTLGAVAGKLTANTSGALNNTSGRIEAAKDTSLTSNAMTNIDGIVVGNALAIDTRSQTLNNLRGALVAASAMNLQTGVLNNHAGLIQASDTLAINTHSQSLANTGAGSIIGQHSVSIDSGALDNSAGQIGAKEQLTITGTTVTNAANGQIISEAGIALNAQQLANNSGKIQSAGNLQASVSGNANNTSGLLRAGQALDLTAASMTNINTQGTDQGIEGHAVTITANAIDNHSGAVRANTTLTVNSSATLDNSAGLISSAQTVNIKDNGVTKALAITNTTGTLIAGTLLDIDSASLGGDGKLLSLGDMTVKLVANYTHTGELTANGKATLETAGTLTNKATLQAGTSLALTAATLDNQAAGKILAPTLNLKATAAHTLTNRGLIDGGDTRLDAVTLNNFGTGRIYGDHLSISATTLNNQVEASNAPVIAARNRLDLGVGTLNNQGKDALIFSVGDLSIGGSLDANNKATGSAGTVNNASATIEALGSLSLNATQINNTNENFTAQLVTTGTQPIDEWVLGATSTRYRPDQVYLTWDKAPGTIFYPPASDGMGYMDSQCFFCDNSDNNVWLHTPGGTTRNFWLYSYTRTTEQTQVLTSDPGKIIAGGNMAVTAGTLNNSNSNVLAGGNLVATIGTLNNVATTGKTVVTEQGYSYYIFDDDDHDDSDRDTYGYGPYVSESGFTLNAGRVEGNTTPGGSGTALTALATGSVGQSVNGAGNASTTVAGGSTVPRITRVTVPGAAGGASTAVATMSPSTTLPSSSLYHTNPAAGKPLVETDPRFANYRDWLTSDYMIKALALDSNTTQKRLGDGFYEQRLINEQVAQLTGRRFLVGYADDETQYKALMDAGVTYAKAWNLRPGVGLTAEQMAQLTSDMVWLVEQDVRLADGSSQKVLVPQLYARTHDGDLAPNGALLADNALSLNVTGDINNLGTLAGRQLVSLTAENINNLGGRMQGKEVWLTARRDINNIGGEIEAGDRIDLFAERNIAIESTTHSNAARTNIDRVASLHVANPGGTLQLAAKGDINLMAAYLINNTPTAAGVPGGATAIKAGGNLTLGTVTTAYAEQVGGGNHARQESGSSEVGSVIQGAGSIALTATNGNITARAADVTSTSGALTVKAGQDIVIESGESTINVAEQHKYKSKGFLSSKTTITRDTLNETTAIASTFSGDTTTLTAGRDIAVIGSNVVATNATTLTAGRDIAITAATEVHNETHYSKTTQSGVFSSGGAGFTIGSRMNSTDQKTDATTAAKSTIGSIDGNVSLTAGNNYRQVGSDVITPNGNIDVTAKRIDIVEARETSKTVTETKTKQSGLTVAVSSPVITAIQTAQQMSEAAKNTQDTRMKLLAAANVGLQANNTYDAIAAGQGGTPAQQAGGINVSVSIGSSKSQSKTTQESNTAVGSTLKAGGNITLTATGAGKDSDITVQGSDLIAGNNVTLRAEDEIKLLAAADTASQRSTNSSSSASVGISYGTDGLLVNVGASGSKGKANGNDLAWNNTHVSAGNIVTLVSGTDTTLKGAVVSGEKVVANVGTSGYGNLVIESLQDQSTYDSKQQSAGVSVSVGMGRMSGSVSFSQSTINSDYASVTEQSGIKAGDGGFEVKVKGDTTLTGGVITSTQKAIDDEKNKFSTDGTLTVTDLQNHAEYTANSTSVNVGSSMSFSGELKPGGTSAGFGKDSDEANSTTKGGISGVAGNTTVRTGDAETGIKPIFDQEKVQKEIEAQTKITQLFGQQASKAVGDYAQTKMDEAKALRAQGKEDEANAIESQWGPNGTLRLAAHTLIGGLTGGVSGAAGAAAGTLTAPLVAEQLKEAGIEGNLATVLTAIASTTVGGVVGGTTGAGTALNEVANNYLTHKQIDQKRQRLADAKTEKDRQTIENEYAALDKNQRDEAAACLINGQCNSVMDPVVIKQVLVELEASCAAPRACSPEARASISELNGLYGKVEGIAKIYPLETLIAFLATGGLSVSAGGVAGVSTGMRMTGGVIGAGTNYWFQDMSQPTDNVNLLIAGITGYLTMGRTLWPTVAINTSGALIGSTIKGEDPYPGMAGAALGTIVGYGAGKAIETPVNNKLNPWYRPDWIKGYLEVSRWNAPSMAPSMSGNVVSSFFQEPTGSATKGGIINYEKQPGSQP